MPEASITKGLARKPEGDSARGVRLALVTNVIPPYHKPLFDRLSQRYANFRILLSTPMESNRPWRLEWENLDVVVQKTITLNRRWQHPRGFSEPLYVHLPIDTVAQLERFRADVVISWEMGTRTLLSAVYRWRHPRTKLLVWAEVAESTEHGRGLLRRAIRRMLHHHVDAFLVTGESGARYLRGLGVADRKISKISYTTDVVKFAAAPLKRQAAQASKFLYVGQLIERKGLLPFLRALCAWAVSHPARQIEFVLAGDGPLRSELKSIQTPGNVIVSLLGNISYVNLANTYAGADIFVLPSLADTWGVVVNEAMAAGLPVLGSVYAQAVSELVEEGRSGWTFRPDVRSEIASALDRSLGASVDQLDRMREYARKTALRLTPDNITDLIDEAITTCIGVHP